MSEKRVLVNFSGEALAGGEKIWQLIPKVLDYISERDKSLVEYGLEDWQL